MNEITRIKDQLEKAFSGGAWHGPSVLESIKDVTLEKASARQTSDTHSILEIVLHIDAWQNVVGARLNGTNTNPTDEEDWPTIKDKNEKAWSETLINLERNFKKLIELVSTFDETKIDEIVVGKNYSNYFMLHGLVQHYVYHAGQISLLKKL